MVVYGNSEIVMFLRAFNVVYISMVFDGEVIEDFYTLNTSTNGNVKTQASFLRAYCPMLI